MKRKVVELAIDVELAHSHGIARIHLRSFRVFERSREIQVVETVHLWQVRHGDPAARRERALLCSSAIALRHMNGILRHLGNDVSFALVRRLTWTRDVHR